MGVIFKLTCVFEHFSWVNLKLDILLKSLKGNIGGFWQYPHLEIERWNTFKMNWSRTYFDNWWLCKNDEKCFLFHLKDFIRSQDI